jgi:hypothetical protein
MRARKFAALMLGVASWGNAQAQIARPVDVMIHLTGADLAPDSENRARATLKRIFDSIGIRVSWVDGQLKALPLPGSPVVIQVLFAKRASDNKAHPDALAYVAEGTKIIVMWDRIHRVAGGGSALEPYILAHALAHEIGHILECSERHSETGVMKARWNAEDLSSMNSKGLEFTDADASLIKGGLIRLKTRGGTPSLPDKGGCQVESTPRSTHIQKP